MSSIELGHFLQTNYRIVVLPFGQKPLSTFADQEWIYKDTQCWKRCQPKVATPITNPNGGPGRGHQSKTVEYSQDDVEAKGTALGA